MQDVIAMEIPAFISPSLCIGRTYDAEKNRAGSHIFPSFLPTKTTDVNKYTFKYKVIKTNNDVRDLLDVSPELSLLVKANVITVSGTGQYISERRVPDETTEVLAVIKCETVHETTDELAKPNDDIMGGPFGDTGTHFATGVIYGAEIIVSFQFKPSSKTIKQAVKGSAEGQLNFQGQNIALMVQMEKLFTALADSTDLSVRYYDTTFTGNHPTSIQDTKRLIEEFPLRLKGINNGQGVPIRFYLQIKKNISPGTDLNMMRLDDLENRLDDLLICQSLVREYAEHQDTSTDDILSFSSNVTKLLRLFRAAASGMKSSEAEGRITACLEGYERALDGSNDIGKFHRHWKKICTINTRPKPTAAFELPDGKRLTVVLFGKTGNGKSATGNTILGEKVFEVSSSASSVTAQCQYGSRRDGREIDVIDTPGVLDTMATSVFNVPKYADYQKGILKEVSKIFAMAPFGFDAVILVVKYGCRFTMEDAQALKMLEALLEEDAKGHMILLLTHGDQAEYEAEEEEISIDQRVSQWLKTLPRWVQYFINQIGNRVVLINNTLRPQKDQEAYGKQLIKLIQVIDNMTRGGTPFTNRLTLASKEVVEERISEAIKASGIGEVDERLEREREDLEKKMKDMAEFEEKKELERRIAENKSKLLATQQQRRELVTKSVQAQAKMSIEGSGSDVMLKIAQRQQSPISFVGGCFPASATFTDKEGRRRSMYSLKIGEEVQVLTGKGISMEPVLTYIHRQPDVMQKYLKITTRKKEKILKITEDHLLFVKKDGQPTAVPVRDVNIGDTVFVRGDHDIVETDTVQSISVVFEKGVYAPVTLTGTILVDDVHTSCYFDLLSHDWSHRAMGIARAVYHVSPWMLQWLSSIGQEDGFPGWCRVAHKMLKN